MAVGGISGVLTSLRTAPVGPHETRGSSVVRPIVFGATDGLVCNLSLIMGVVAAAREDPHAVVVAGIAGLLAGGFSMAVGEYVSVASQRELAVYQETLQRQQLTDTPEQERAILFEIYRAKGLTEHEAALITDRIMAGPDSGLDTFVREEIGLSEEAVGNPVSAAIGSLGAFAAGAIIPLLPFLLGLGSAAVPLAIGLSVVALFGIGLAVSRLTHRGALRTGLRQAGLGLLAAGVTYGIGSLLGAAVH
jgi:VIT1/CCC1 family predicted Fe2+/Mn2+ transporter